MPLTVDDPMLVRGKRVLVIEDGPTVTHGEMAYGAGVLAAKQYGAAALVDPRPAASEASVTPCERTRTLTACCPPWAMAGSKSTIWNRRSTGWTAILSSLRRPSILGVW